MMPMEYASRKAIEALLEVAKRGIDQTVETIETRLGKEEIEKTILIKPDMVLIREMSLKTLEDMNAEKLAQSDDEMAVMSENMEFEETDITSTMELTNDQKEFIMNETGWPEEIVDHIENMDQYEVYRDANLQYALVNERPCLVKTLDMDYVDSKTGLTNKQLMENGRAPIDANTGEKIELHHMGQDFDSPFAELCENSEHGDGKDGILHDKKVETWRRDPEQRNQYTLQRINHWKTRGMEG